MSLLSPYIRTVTGERTVNVTEANVSTTFSDGQNLTTLDNGNWVAVWNHSDGAGTIYGQILDPLGTPLGGLIQISVPRFTPGGSALFQADPVVTPMVGGGFAVAWTTEEYNGGYNTGRNVMTRTFDATGTPLGDGEVTVLQVSDQGYVSTSSWETQPAIARLADTGALALAYYDDLEIGVKILASDAASTQTTFQANTVTAEDQRTPHVAGLAGGGMVVTWVGDDLPGGSSQGVFARLFASDGTPLGPEFQVNTTTVGGQNGPRAAALSGGGFVVTWYDGYDESTESFRGQMTARIYSATGVAQGDEFALAPDYPAGYGGEANQDVVGLSDGGFFTVFTGHVDYFQDRSDIFGCRFDAAGNRLGDIVHIGTIHLSYQTAPRAALLEDGRVAVTWYSSEADGRPAGLYSQILQMAAVNGVATDGDDFLVFDDAGHAIDLLAGDDTATGGAGRDTLLGSEGDDLLSGRAGADVLDGGDGNDLIYGGDQDDSLSGQGGNDTIHGGNGRDLVSMGAGDDIFHDTTQGGAYGRDTVYGQDGNDTIQGGNGGDAFYGGTGFDLIFGRLGNDVIFGGDQDDTIYAGAGNDTVNGGNGRDLVYLEADDDSFTDMAQFNAYGADKVFGGGGNDTMAGNGGRDTLVGEDGNDLLFGGDQDDVLVGGSGNDTVYGGNGQDRAFLGEDDDIFFDNGQTGPFGADSISGEGGNDTLRAGGGNDTLSGGAGADRFVFVGSQIDHDTVTDYAAGEDLYFDQSLWGGGLSSAQVVAQFADDSGADVVFDFGGGNTVTLTGLDSSAGLDADLFFL